MLGDVRSAIGFWVRAYGWGLLMGLAFSALLVSCSENPTPQCKIESARPGVCRSTGRAGIELKFSDGHAEVLCEGPAPSETPGI